MSKAILISNQEVINSLYEVNLRAYLDTQIISCTDFDGAMQAISKNTDADILIIASGDHVSENLLSLKKDHADIFVITVGPAIDESADVLIENKYDIKSLLQAIAKKKNITAKDMASLAVPDFFPIPLKLISAMKKTYCNLYLQGENGDYQLVLEKGNSLDELNKKFGKLQITYLYIEATERLFFINSSLLAVTNEAHCEALTTAERSEITQQGLHVIAEEMFKSDEVSEMVVHVSKACMASINRTIKEVPKLRNLLALFTENQSDFCYKHTVLATYIASEIIKNVSWGSKEQVRKVCFCLFFHDIFLVPIYKKLPDVTSEEELLNHPEITEADKKTVMAHAKLAGEIVKTFPRCPMGADVIITQHHGVTSGQGFSDKYSDNISPLSKVMMIAEESANYLIVQMSDENGEKIEIDKATMITILKNKFKNHTYTKIIDTLESISL